MNAFSSRTFKSGNSVALRLPRGLGIEANVEMRIEKEGDALVVRPAKKPAAEKAKLRRLIATLDALRAPGEIAERDPIQFPERPDLI